MNFLIEKYIVTKLGSGFGGNHEDIYIGFCFMLCNSPTFDKI